MFCSCFFNRIYVNKKSELLEAEKKIENVNKIYIYKKCEYTLIQASLDLNESGKWIDYNGFLIEIK